MKKRRFPLQLALIALTLTANLTARCAEYDVREDCVLLINSPQLWTEPAQDAAAEKTHWKAGARVTVIETKKGETAGTTWERVFFDGDEGWLPGVYLTEPPQTVDPAKLSAIGTEPVDRFHGIAPEYAPGDLVSIGPRYNDEIDYKLRAEAAEAHERLVKAAKADGVYLYVVSGYRSWKKQQRIYQGKLKRSGWEQDTVAKPGHSEHQLGVAIDYTDGELATLLKPEFGEAKAGKWLAAHAPQYGFAVTYTIHNRHVTGYAPEPWHYRYWGNPELAKAKHEAALGL